MIIDQNTSQHQGLYEIDSKQLTMYVKPIPLFLRMVLYFITIISFIVPVQLIVFALLNEGFRLGHFVGIGISALISYYFLRLSLWNTKGKCTLTRIGDRLEYQADFGWFKTKAELIPAGNMNYSIEKVGYEDENLGFLCVKTENFSKNCAVKMSIDQLENLIIEWSKGEEAIRIETEQL